MPEVNATGPTGGGPPEPPEPEEKPKGRTFDQMKGSPQVMSILQDAVQVAPAIASAVNSIFKVIKAHPKPEDFAKRMAQLVTHEAKRERELIAKSNQATKRRG